MDLPFTPKSLLLLIAAGTLSLSAAAQWQWIDKDGRKVFSDRPPTADIKEKDILKQPGGRSRPAAAPAAVEPVDGAVASAPAAKASAAANSPKISGKDAELQARKKKLEEEEAAKKKAEDDKLAAARAENCDRAKKGLATFDSGVRVSSVNSKGEREILDDQARAAETKRLQALIASECK